jgi:hypothetical protein
MFDLPNNLILEPPMCIFKQPRKNQYDLSWPYYILLKWANSGLLNKENLVKVIELNEITKYS